MSDTDATDETLRLPETPRRARPMLHTPPCTPHTPHTPSARAARADEVPLSATCGTHHESDGEGDAGVRRPVSFKRRSMQRASRLSYLGHWLARSVSRASGDLLPHGSHLSAPPLLPSAQASNPIPRLPYTVLCLLIFGEFSSSGVAGPFLFFMINDFGVGDESSVGFWAGIVASVFFFAQFLTSLLWASAAEKRGRRSVLQLSLVGNTLSLLGFGLARSLPVAILFRLSQGFFNGAAGVAKGAVRDLTDETNEGRAYAQMGFCWGMGGIVGPILGGLLEHPVRKYPWLFGSSAFLARYPYFLPCAVASVSTAVGACLSLFLEPNAGPPSAVRLDDTDADAEAQRESVVDLWSDGASDDEDGAAQAQHSASSPRVAPPLLHSPAPRLGVWSALGARHSVADAMHAPRGLEAAAHRHGSAYGYVGGPRRRLASLDTPLQSRRAVSAFALRQAESEERAKRQSNMSLMERFVLANDDTVLSITDLWVAAAANGDESHAPADGSHADDDSASDASLGVDADDAPPLFGHALRGSERHAPSSSVLYLPPRHFAREQHALSHGAHAHADGGATPRAVHSEVPGGAAAPSASLWALIPVVVIAHYGVVSFHSATFEQVFMAFLVTPEPSGGLGLTAGHYAVLIAAMALCQLLFQFKVYPSVGPPHGPLSHVAMLQLGLAVHFPCYVLFPILRAFVSSTDVLVMFAMIAFATLRWFANVLSFTSIMVLLNAWTPPHLVPLANGLAQTVSSAARCVGPIIGGIAWARSIAGGPNARSWPFNYQFGFWLVGLVALAAFVGSRFLREPVGGW
ncbi:hypothetical protein MSPP1_001847 [Malassezia sp. CBS 17886]|nr:hypothetical protein MSPP1_001847 [Malassezia sp. CBS 17886]